MSFRLPSESVLVFLSITWMGMLLGVSFLAAPVKFQASSLELPVALEVGRVTFAAFSRIEWGLAALIGILVLLRSSPLAIGLATFTALIVVVQALWLLPILDARVEAVISGQPRSPSIHHALYAVAEGCKVFALAALAIATMNGRGAHVPVNREWHSRCD